MYLKSIEINGFKSFANKITFEFPHGITGIVGPNGSGKSNIGDAVRWVLGEQSAKQLRGSRMEDVIFSGTESRKPLGFAYVAITFENSDRKIGLDYDEIKVARRVYRSGESEYLINGAVCRRRQIVELFYDTGIGKEGYSIIGQGQVEKILSGRLEDSRELFDEAAGIAKFKKDRNMTEKSLEKARADLERVTDMLLELEKQVGPLEEQSEKAKKFLSLRDREKDIDIQLFLRDYAKAREEKEKTEQDLTITTEQLESTRSIYLEKKEKNNQVQQKAEEYDNEVDRLEAALSKQRTEKSAMDLSMVELNHEMEKNVLLDNQYLANLQQAEKDIAGKESQIQEEENAIHQEEILLQDYQDALTLLDVDRQKISDHLSALESAKMEEQERMLNLLSTSSEVKEKLSRVATLEEQLNIRNAEYNSRYLTLQTEIKEYHERAEELTGEMESLSQSQVEYSSQYQQSLAQNKEKEAELTDLQKQMDENNQDFLRHRSRYETLSGLTERYEGYQRSIQHVMEQKKKQPGILGVVADILTMDQRYELAIEIALGGALQNIVTENESVAKNMIQFLKKNRLGRATFLPLTSIRKRNIAINPSILEEEGVVGVASQLVSSEERYKNLIESLLGRTVVAEDMDCALYLAKKYNFSLRIVTIDGELLNPGGAITGGAFRNNSNLLGRNREMEESMTAMKKARELHGELKKKVESLQEELRQSRENLLKEKQTLDAAEIHLTELQNQIPMMQEKEKELKERLENLKTEHKIIQHQLEEIKAQRRALSSHKEDEDQNHEDNKDLIEELDQKIQEASDRAEELQKSYSELLLKQSQSQQKIDFARQTIHRLQEEIASLKDQISTIKEAQNKILLENRQYEAALNLKKTLLESSQENIRQLEKELEDVKKKRRKITEELNETFREMEAQNEQLRILDRQENRLSTRLENLEKDLENQNSYMWENYEMTYNYALTYLKEDITKAQLQQMRQDKKTIRQEIKALGDVHVGAIEKFKEVGERYTFTKQQYDDIKESEAKLLDLIDQFNTQMRAQFKEKFSEIQTMFMEVFRNLFEGGSASLELMDDSNILECGIRIIAQPPGKKLQNIMLLSGGERALTAIALLFAIQNLKPSPFCLLDEIEAALDDANIIRFSKYLRNLSKDTQFIVITHRRGTMNAADVLYGITMQEKGISTLISVDLIDKQLGE